MAKGYAQLPGCDFQETFAPVARASSIRLMMALAVEQGLTVHQMDVVTAFLNGEIEEELYMELPEEFEAALKEIINKHENDQVKPNVLNTTRKWLKELQTGKRKACRIKKALYGLRQSGRQWYKRLDNELKQIGLKPLKADPCVYISKNKQNSLLLSWLFM